MHLTWVQNPALRVAEFPNNIQCWVISYLGTVSSSTSIHRVLGSLRTCCGLYWKSMMVMDILFCLFVGVDSLHPGQLFFSYVGTVLPVSCARTQCSASEEARTCNPSILSQVLFH